LKWLADQNVLSITKEAEEKLKEKSLRDVCNG